VSWGSSSPERPVWRASLYASRIGAGPHPAATRRRIDGCSSLLAA
jgi:hypothetical protein